MIQTLSIDELESVNGGHPALLLAGFLIGVSVCAAVDYLADGELG